MSNFDDLMKKILLEAIEKERLVEKKMLEELEASDQAGFKSKGSGSGEFQKYLTKDAGGKGYFDVQELVTNLIAGTELERGNKALTRKSDSYFALIRQRQNAGKLNTNQEILQYLNGIFGVRETTPDETCTDVATLSTSFLVNTAFAMILRTFNESSAGFVSERLIAGLLGGVTVSTNSGTIADLTIQNERIGISLKVNKGDVHGSLKSLFETLGIPVAVYATSRSKKMTYYDYSKIKHPNGLKYLIALKDGDGKDSKLIFSMFDVQRDDIIKILDDAHVPLGKNPNSRAQKTYYHIDNPLKEEIIGKLFLGNKLEDLQNNKLGISNFVNASFEISIGEEQVNNRTKEIGDQFARTLTGLNNYLLTVKETIFKYSLDPTYQNLSDLITMLEDASKFIPEKLTKC